MTQRSRTRSSGHTYQEVIGSEAAGWAEEADQSKSLTGFRSGTDQGEWNERLLVETVLSMLTLVWHFKKVMHRVWDYFHARLAFTMAAFNLLVQWDGLKPDDKGYVHLSIAEFSL
jgi:hypothetical protein